MTPTVHPESEVGISPPPADPVVISSTPVVAMLEALVDPEGAAAVLAAAGIAVWATLGELTEAESARLRAEVARRCAVRSAIRQSGFQACR